MALSGSCRPFRARAGRGRYLGFRRSGSTLGVCPAENSWRGWGRRFRFFGSRRAPVEVAGRPVSGGSPRDRTPAGPRLARLTLLAPTDSFAPSAASSTPPSPSSIPLALSLTPASKILEIPTPASPTRTPVPPAPFFVDIAYGLVGPVAACASARSPPRSPSFALRRPARSAQRHITPNPLLQLLEILLTPRPPTPAAACAPCLRPPTRPNNRCRPVGTVAATINCPPSSTTASALLEPPARLHDLAVGVAEVALRLRLGLAEGPLVLRTPSLRPLAASRASRRDRVPGPGPPPPARLPAPPWLRGSSGRGFRADSIPPGFHHPSPRRRARPRRRRFVRRARSLDLCVGRMAGFEALAFTLVPSSATVPRANPSVSSRTISTNSFLNSLRCSARKRLMVRKSGRLPPASTRKATSSSILRDLRDENTPVA